MWPFSRKSSQKKGRAVENPALEAAIIRHRMEPTDDSVVEVGLALNAAKYLVPVLTDQVTFSAGVSQQVMIEPGSIIKFMVCENTSGERYLPAFTDWHELRRWAGENVNGFVLESHDLWQFYFHDKNSYAGIVINPASNPWTLLPPNIHALLADFA